MQSETAREASKIMGVRVDASKSSYIWNRRIYLCTGRNALRCKIGVGTGGNWRRLADRILSPPVLSGVFLLTGGVGSPVGAIIGSAIICVISNVIVLFGVNVYWQEAVDGFVVVICDCTAISAYDCPRETPVRQRRRRELIQYGGDYMEKYFIGIDSGTSGIKAVLFDLKGNELGAEILSVKGNISTGRHV